MNPTLTKLAKKLKISEQQIVKMLAEEQLRNNHYKNLVEIEFGIDSKADKLLKRLSKSLKISQDSVVSVLLQDYIEYINAKLLKDKV